MDFTLPSGKILGRSGQYITVNGVRSYYEEHGEGPSLMLMHGGMATIESLYFQVRDLMSTFKVILLERRGHGRTADVPGPITYENMTQDTVAFMKALNLTKVPCVGWSDGGIIALRLATYFPDLVGLSIFISISHSSTGNTSDFMESVRTMGPNDVGPMIVNTWKAVSPDGPEYWPTFFEKMKTLFLSQWEVPLAEIAHISSPSLIMMADHDIVTFQDNLETFHAISQSQFAVVPGADHLMLFTKPEQVNPIIKTFLVTPFKAQQDGAGALEKK